jgi:ATP-dependent Clp protease adaptor protein ClpS
MAQTQAHTPPVGQDLDPSTATLPEQEQQTRRLPPFKVILHNDDVNDFQHVILTILKLTPLGPEEALEKTLEAHETGTSLLLVTTKERAELYVEQFATFNLTVTAEPDD